MLSRILAGLLSGTCVRCEVRSFSPVCAACQTASVWSFVTDGGLLVRALGLYESPVGAGVRLLKYGESTFLADRLGEAMAKTICRPTTPFVLCPVPLHPARLAERGYNQAALVARALGEVWGVGTKTDGLFRTTHTETQATLGRKDRRANVAGAFVAGRHTSPVPCVLVDDVVTTGATLDACSSALQKAGATVIGALACAIAEGRPVPSPAQSSGMHAKTGH